MKVLVILGFMLLLPIMFGASADACQYVESDNTIQENFEEYDFIFSAKILTVGEYASYTPVTLKVIEQWKGDTHDTAYLFTCKGKDFGGLQLQEDKSYLIFAEKLSSDSPIVTDFSPTKLLSEAQDDILFLDQKSHVTRFHYDESNVVKQTPLQQFNSGIQFDEIQCKDGLVLIQKYDGTPACVTESTKTKLIERGWTGNNEDQSNVNDTNTNQNDLQKQNIIRIEDGRISLYPESTCASISLELLAEKDIQRYKNDERGLNATNVLPITTDDFDEIPILEELIYAVNLLEFPYNKHSSVYMDGLTFVEYEFFLMDKAIQKYGDSQGDYFLNLDSDYEERFSNPKKQGFTNHFIAPLIVYNENVYSIDGVYFWTADEHNPKRMGVYPKDSIGDDEKFIMLTEDDMKSIPKIKQAIKEIGTIKESIHGIKGVSEGTQNEYMQWLKEKSQERLGSDQFRLVEYDNQFYAISFLIC